MFTIGTLIAFLFIVAANLVGIAIWKLGAKFAYKIRFARRRDGRYVFGSYLTPTMKLRHKLQHRFKNSEEKFLK